MAIDAETLDAIRAAVRDEISGKLPQKKKRHDRRINLQVRLLPEEIAAVDAACLARNLCRSDLLRSLLEPVISRVLTVNREIPPNFRRAHNRRKAAHHTDSATDDRARSQATRRLTEISIERSAILADLAAATAQTNTPGMLSDAAGASAPPKLPRSR